jgi:hypothetical protein
MPRIKKTSSQPKKQIKKFIPKQKPVYPEYIELFIKEVESKTSAIVKVDQYSNTSGYEVGINLKVGKVYRCIWWVGMVTSIDYLNMFWTSDAYKSLSQ